jgi:hypothetical protein
MVVGGRTKGEFPNQFCSSPVVNLEAGIGAGPSAGRPHKVLNYNNLSICLEPVAIG